jgi:hypothetical protein
VTNDDYEYPPQIGEIMRGILCRLARSLTDGDNVICLDAERLRRGLINGLGHGSRLCESSMRHPTAQISAPIIQANAP